MACVEDASAKEEGCGSMTAGDDNENGEGMAEIATEEGWRADWRWPFREPQATSQWMPEWEEQAMNVTMPRREAMDDGVAV